MGLATSLVSRTFVRGGGVRCVLPSSLECALANRARACTTHNKWTAFLSPPDSPSLVQLPSTAARHANWHSPTTVHGVHTTPFHTTPHSFYSHASHPPTHTRPSSSATARPAPCVAASTSPALNSFLRRHPAKGANPPLPLAPPLPPPPPPPRPPPPLPTSHREPRRRCRVSLRFTHAGAMWS